MNRRSTVNRLLLALALIGLVLGPLVTFTLPASAAAAVVSMQDNMPCCPDGEPMVPDCTSNCPFAVLCVVGAANGATDGGDPLVFPLSLRETIRNVGSGGLSSLAGEPPPRPPKA